MMSTIADRFYNEYLNHFPLFPVVQLQYSGYIDVNISLPKSVCEKASVCALVLVVKTTYYNQRMPIVKGTHFISLCMDFCGRNKEFHFGYNSRVSKAWKSTFQCISSSIERFRKVEDIRSRKAVAIPQFSIALHSSAQPGKVLLAFHLLHCKDP